MQASVRRLASGGCDQALRLWSQGQDGVWRAEGPPLAQHTGWVRDVAFAPNLGLPRTCVATAGQDGKVLAWIEEASNPGVRPFGCLKCRRHRSCFDRVAPCLGYF
jgi:WD40 repeat protein